MKGLSLKLLGSPEAQHDGQPLRFRAKKALALLAYLATEGGLHRRERLVDLLWPASDDSRGRAALRSTLAGLRATLAEAGESSEPPYIVAEGDHLGLRFGPHTQLDLQGVEAALRQMPTDNAAETAGRPAALAGLRSAAEAYRGEFLEGFSLGDTPEFDSWLDGERESWRRRAGLVHAKLAKLEFNNGQPEAAAAVAARWLEQDPTDEAVGALLMEVCAALGDGAKALEAYETVRRSLAELGAEPGPALAGLATGVRMSSARLEPPTPRGVPLGLPDLPFVGRAAAFGALVEAYRVASRGRDGGGGEACVVAVTGEAGIGKTRLVEEFSLWARAQGAEVLRGGALETRGRLPYAPVVGALRSRLDGERAADNLLSDLWLAELSRLLPELSERYPGLPVPVADEALAQAHLFEAVARLVGALAERAPVVLALDDLQWADEGTFDLLRHAARRWSELGAPVLLVVSLRAEALGTDRTLSAWVSWLVRDRRARHLELEALDGGDVARLLGTSTGGTSGGDPAALERFCRWLLAETGGLPLFLTETLRAFVDDGLVTIVHSPGGGWTLDISIVAHDQAVLRRTLPAGVQEVIRARLAHLSPGVSEVLSAGAVLGQRFGFEALLQVAGLGVDEGLTLLDEAQRARLVREADAWAEDLAPQGFYAFSHDKIRDVAYTEAGSARRRVFHRRALETLEREGAPPPELARHALGARLPEPAFSHLLAAGDQAMALFAVGDSINYYEQARSLLRGKDGRGASVEPSPSKGEHLYVNLGRALELAGRWEEAKGVYGELRECCRKAGEPRVELVALNRLAILAALRSQDLAGASALIMEALAVAEAVGDRAAVAETRWNLAQMASLSWRPDEAIALAQDALSVARELGNKELAASCLIILSFANAVTGRWEECVGYVERAITLYGAFGDQLAQRGGTLGATFLWAGLPASPALANRAMKAICLSGIATGEVNLGRPGSGVEASRRALEIACELSNPSAEATATIILNRTLSETGHYKEALRVAQRAVQITRGIGAVGIMGSPGLSQALLALGQSLQNVNKLGEARKAYQEAEAYKEAEENLSSNKLSVLSKLCAVWGMAADWDAAYAYAQKALASRKKLPSQLNAWDFGRHHEVEALLRGGDEASAREEVQRLGEAVRENRRFRLVHLRMQVVLARWDGQLEEALRRLREAAALADELGLPGELWEVYAALGDLLNERGEREEARKAFGRAAETILTLAGRIEDETLRENFVSAPHVRWVLARR